MWTLIRREYFRVIITLSLISRNFRATSNSFEVAFFVRKPFFELYVKIMKEIKTKSFTLLRYKVKKPKKFLKRKQLVSFLLLSYMIMEKLLKSLRLSSRCLRIFQVFGLLWVFSSFFRLQSLISFIRLLQKIDTCYLAEKTYADYLLQVRKNTF